MPCEVHGSGEQDGARVRLWVHGPGVASEVEFAIAVGHTTQFPRPLRDGTSDVGLEGLLDAPGRASFGHAQRTFGCTHGSGTATACRRRASRSTLVTSTRSPCGGKCSPSGTSASCSSNAVLSTGRTASRTACAVNCATARAIDGRTVLVETGTQLINVGDDLIRG